MGEVSPTGGWMVPEPMVGSAAPDITQLLTGAGGGLWSKRTEL